MEKLNVYGSIILTALNYGIIYFFGGSDLALQSLVIVIAIDYLTGLAAAFYNKNLNSKVGFKGLIKKLSYFLAIALAVAIDKLTSQSGLIRSLVIYYFVANDGLSIIENLGKMNIKLPKKLSEALEQLKKDD